MQPWAWLIVNGHKDIENREWPTRYRGPVAIHAGKKLDRGAGCDLRDGIHPVTGEPYPPAKPEWECGGIVGVAEIVDCWDIRLFAQPNPWFVGTYGFVLANARPVPFIPVSGALSFFNWRRRL